MINLRRFWPTIAQDVDDDGQDDGTTLQTLTDGTAQQLCQRIWKAYISNDMTQFPDFMNQIDSVCTNFVQAQPVPVDAKNLEDAELPAGPFDLPSIGPEQPDEEDDNDN